MAPEVKYATKNKLYEVNGKANVYSLAKSLDFTLKYYPQYRSNLHEEIKGFLKIDQKERKVSNNFKQKLECLIDRHEESFSTTASRNESSEI